MSSSQSKRVVIAGGSGFLGVSLAFHLSAANWQVIILSRNRPRPEGPWQYVAWDARSAGTWAECLDGAAGLVNLLSHLKGKAPSADLVVLPEGRAPPQARLFD